MNYILFDISSDWNNLLPLTFTRPIAELRVGILTIKEKWEKHLEATVTYNTIDYLKDKFTQISAGENLLINGSVIPDTELVRELMQLKSGEVLAKENVILGVVLNKNEAEQFSEDKISQFKTMTFSREITKVCYPWDIFELNGSEIAKDHELITKNRKSKSLSKTNNIIKPENIFVEEGAQIEYATVNASAGPVYIGKNAEIMEGAVIRGPFALCEHAVIKMSAKIYGPVTIGPYSKVGGEVSESVIMGYSNKAHDGFLGNAVIGEWCNLGADTNNSNLKNNYTEVKVWNYPKESFIKTGLQFCGLIMGDHSKCGINTMFNTGTVVGVSANIFGSGFPRNFVPSFSWGGAQGYMVYTLNKVYETVEKVFARRKLEFSQKEKDILKAVFDRTEKFRKF